MIVQRYHTNKKKHGLAHANRCLNFLAQSGTRQSHKDSAFQGGALDERAGPPASYLQPQVS